jgi:hypothetical protein
MSLYPGFSFWPPGLEQYTAIAPIATKFFAARPGNCTNLRLAQSTNDHTNTLSTTISALLEIIYDQDGPKA